MISRRTLLAAIGAVVLPVQPPTPARAAPTPQDEALAYIAKRVRESISSMSIPDRKYIFPYAIGKRYTPELEAEWLDEDRSVAAVDRMLRHQFKTLQVIPTHFTDHEFPPVYRDGKLTRYGQNVVLWLPMTVYDQGNRDFLHQMDILAPRYL